MTTIISILSSAIDLNLVNNITNIFESLQTSFQLLEFKKVGSDAGLFCEGVLMALWQLHNNSQFTITGVDFGTKCDQIMNEQKYQIDIAKSKEENDEAINRDESIRLFIPRTLLFVYTIRSKRQVAHLRGVEIDYIDSLLIVQACGWILAELLSIVSGIPNDEIMVLVQDVGKMHLPIVEWIHNEIVVSKANLTRSQALVIIIAASGGSMPHAEAIKALQQNFPNDNRTAAYSARDIAIDNEWIHRTQSDILALRAKGWLESKKIASL